MNAENLAVQMGVPILENFQALEPIDVEKDRKTVKCDLKVDPGKTRIVRIFDPDGKPLSGAHVRGADVFSHLWSPRPLTSHEVTIKTLGPRKPRWVFVVHSGKELGGMIQVKADRDEPLSLQLQRTGTIIGRVLDPDGQPWKNKDLRVYYDHPSEGYLLSHRPDVLRTDKDGKFRISGVFPGATYQINVGGTPPNITIASVATGLKLTPGETRDLGDAKARLFPQ
jgi:hypothetical protein